LIIAVGLFFVWLKIGRKLRAPLVILRPNTSWMSREVYAVGLFYLAAIADWFWPGAVLHLLTAVAAALFLYCQVRILHAGMGIPAWRVPVMPALLFASGLLEGAGLLAVIYAFADMPANGWAGLFEWGALTAVATGALWLVYLVKAKSWGIPPLSRAVLNRVAPWVILGGHAAPLALFAAALFAQPVSLFIPGLAGVLTVAGGAFWKAVVITRAAHQQGFALAKMPRRGSGRYAAPSLVEAA
jgi:phenylacetyl-CoA:acceptor oxidoreductase subunit 2